MGKALEILTGFVTAPGTTLTALTMATGDSLTTRAANGEPAGKLISMWTDSQGLGQLQIRSPRFHDNVQGITIQTAISEVQPLEPMGATQDIYAQDTMTGQLSGSATAGDIETACMLIYYDDLPGSDANLVTWDDIRDKIESIMISTNTLALGTAGGYSGSEAINAEVDNWKANRDYALLGYQTTVECACIRWQGSDVANLGLGGPGHENFKDLTGRWFASLSTALKLPTIPIFNAANKQSILISGAQDENGADPTVTSIFGLLRQ
jgi:hypothetical protein